MDGNARWNVGCYIATAAVLAATAYLWGSSNPALTGVFLSASGLNLICAGNEYKKYKDKEKNLTGLSKEKDNSKSNQKIRTNERNLSNEDTKAIATNHLAKIRNSLAKNIDETFGTHLKEEKLPEALQKIEEPLGKVIDKVLSNKKVKE